MKKNEIYALVDEDYLSKFSLNHQSFMKDYYYKFYYHFCQHYHRTPLSQDKFYTNMRRRRIRLYQLCCPYCGTIHIMPVDKRLQGTNGFNYCPYCGKGSTTDNVLRQIYRFVRIHGINKLGLEALEKDHPDTEKWLLAYDCFQMEIIELASIIEVVFRDCFEALLFIHGFNKSTTYNDYATKIIKKYNGNDFMNVEKANNIYKKAFNISIRDLIDKQDWNNLIDLVNLRNMMVHNNGMVDERFKSTPSFTRLHNHVEGSLFKLEDADIAKYLKSVILAVTKISDIYLEKYLVQRNATIANHYFNNTHINLHNFTETN